MKVSVISLMVWFAALSLSQAVLAQPELVPIYPEGVTSCSQVPPSATQVADRLYFLAKDDPHGCELWVTDGTLSGTALVADIQPGFRDAFPDGQQRLREFEGELLFVADDGVHGLELWKTVGNVEAVRLTDICEGPCSAFDTDPNFDTWILFGGLVLFIASDTQHGAELWRTDGTQSGTFLLKDINPGPGDSFIFSDYSDYVPYFTNLGELVVFAATDTQHGFELWRTDGSPGGTDLVRDIRPGPASALVVDSSDRDLPVNEAQSEFDTSDGLAIFTALGVEGNRETWESDGSLKGTRRRTDSSVPVQSSDLSDTGCSISNTRSRVPAIILVCLFFLCRARWRREPGNSLWQPEVTLP